MKEPSRANENSSPATEKRELTELGLLGERNRMPPGWHEDKDTWQTEEYEEIRRKREYGINSVGEMLHKSEIDKEKFKKLQETVEGQRYRIFKLKMEKQDLMMIHQIERRSQEVQDDIQKRRDQILDDDYENYLIEKEIRDRDEQSN